MRTPHLWCSWHCAGGKTFLYNVAIEQSKYDIHTRGVTHCRKIDKPVVKSNVQWAVPNKIKIVYDI